MRFFLKTQRLKFRTWSDHDVALALGLWGDERVTKYIYAQGKLSEDEVRGRLEQEIANDKKFGIQYWPIFLKSTNAHIGCCGIRPYDPEGDIEEIGFQIRADHWGCGFATEAANAVINYAFTKRSVKGLFAGHNPNNTVSRHLLKKLGFRYTHDEFYPPTGLNHPSYIMMRNDYLEMNATKNL
jgi:RimJ/RimL family protein N-acetyltransferase